MVKVILVSFKIDKFFCKMIYIYVSLYGLSSKEYTIVKFRMSLLIS